MTSTNIASTPPALALAVAPSFDLDEVLYYYYYPYSLPSRPISCVVQLNRLYEACFCLFLLIKGLFLLGPTCTRAVAYIERGGD